MRNPFRHKRGVALVGTLCAALGLVMAPAVAATPVGPAVPTLDWQPCDTGFFCATATVPLDYADPAGATVNIAMIKRPATDAAHRIGSVFYNPGGPGESGVTDLPVLYPVFPPALRARFDLVSFDPRGFGRSTNLKCFDTTEQEQRFLSTGPAGFPVGPAQVRAWDDMWAAFDKACAAHAGPLLAHDTTADVARDLDLMRQAVGDRALNYMGTSYGTMLGATYANLFPTKVRAMTLDGNADPVAWATGTGGSANRLGTFLRLGSDKGSAATLNAFLDLCGRAATAVCPFSAGTPAATHAKFDTVLNRLASHPLTVNGTTITEPILVKSAIVALYHALPFPDANGTSAWSELAASLQGLWTLTTGAPASATAPITLPDANLTAPGLGTLPNATAPNADVPYDGREKLLAVICSDSPNPRDAARYPAQSALSSARSGAVGPGWVWGVEACVHWPVRSADRYAGPWNHPTAPILVVGNTIDPATPYSGAVAMSHDLANARLLTVNGYGHSALTNHSTCVDTVEDAYFVTGALPAPGTVCRQDRVPFAG